MKHKFFTLVALATASMLMMNACGKDDDKDNDNDARWVDLGLPSGLLWASYNVGASAPEQYGDYFAWAQTRPMAQPSKGDVLPASEDAATAIWGKGARIPTSEEWEEMLDNTTSTWAEQNGVGGRTFTSRKNGNSIFLPAAGYLRDSTYHGDGNIGFYWTSSYGASGNDNSIYISFGALDEDTKINDVLIYPEDGQSVRAVRAK